MLRQSGLLKITNTPTLSVMTFLYSTHVLGNGTTTVQCQGNNTGECDATKEYCANMANKSINQAGDTRLVGECRCLSPYQGNAGSCATGEQI